MSHTYDKVRKKLAKCLAQMRRHDPDVTVSESPTNILYVGNSGVLCGVQWEELEAVFEPYGPIVDICVSPTGRPYSFVKFESVEKAGEAFDALHGTHPSQVAKADVVFYLAFITNMPRSTACFDQEMPPGLKVVEEFASEDEQQKLLDIVATCSNGESKGSLKNRRVFHFGFEFLYGSNTVNLDGPFPPPFPPICEALIDRMCQAQLVKHRPDQLTINVYEPGHGIPSHVDTHSAFEDEIVSLSLSSDVVMNFRECSVSGRSVAVRLPARSLTIMKGESRYAWEHCIASRNYDCDPASSRLIRRSQRVSFTFRKVRRAPCECDFPQLCDRNRDDNVKKLPSSDTEARGLEKTFVANVYEEIAAHFDETRYSQWRAVKTFLDELASGSILLDVGCGNGKYLNEDSRLLKVGCDMSANLCLIASAKGACVAQADGLHLPFRDGAFDALISIAVIHHMSTVERRLVAIGEMLRMLRPGGTALITVWAFEQKMNNEQSEYLKWGRNRESLVDRPEDDASANPSGALLVHLNNTAFQQQDLLVPWHRKAPTDGASPANPQSDRFLRFYHVFKRGELEDLCAKIPHCRLISTSYEQGNWIVVIQRI